MLYWWCGGGCIEHCVLSGVDCVTDHRECRWHGEIIVHELLYQTFKYGLEALKMLLDCFHYDQWW